MENRILIEIDRDSVAAADDFESHLRRFEIPAGLTVEQLLEAILKSYELPNVADKHVWFTGKINGKTIFVVNKYGKNGLFGWKWRCETEFIEKRSALVEMYVDNGLIRLTFKYHFHESKFEKP